MGGLLLMAADLLARWLIAPQELPVGVLTAVLGGSYLLWLMHRRSAARSASGIAGDRRCEARGSVQRRRWAASQVLHGIDLALAAGRWTSIVGPNGAGKSTLLKALAGPAAASRRGAAGRAAARGAGRAARARAACPGWARAGRARAVPTT